MSSRHHIPFPRTFLTVNVPLKSSGNNKTSSSSTSTSSAATPSTSTSSTERTTPAAVPGPVATLPLMGFLSNRPAPRHDSMSSVSSDESTASASTVSPAASSSATTVPAEAEADAVTASVSPALKPTANVPAWLSLNEKYAVPPPAEDLSSALHDGGFLSNRR